MNEVELNQVQYDSLHRMQSMPWLMLPQAFPKYLMGYIKYLTSGSEVESEYIQVSYWPKVSPSAKSLRLPKVEGKVAVVPVYGFLAQKRRSFDYFADTSTEQLVRVLESLAMSKGVGAIILDIESPGGLAIGTEEAAKRILELREQKPIYAIANSLAASAAYWIASSATKLYVTPSGSIGSIGVFTSHTDVTEALARAGIRVTLIHAGKYKVETSSFVNLSDEGKEKLQKDVDEIYGRFVEGVAAGRGVSTKKVMESYGEGRLLSSKEALEVGAVDGIASLEDIASSILPKPKLESLSAALAKEENFRIEARKKQLAVPPNPPGGEGKGVEGQWTRPTLSDFTDQRWEDLSAAERRSISSYFAWYSDLESFGSLKLPHHFPPNHRNGKRPSLNGVRNALARLDQTQGISDEEKGRVRSHLRSHLPED